MFFVANGNAIVRASHGGNRGGLFDDLIPRMARNPPKVLFLPLVGAGRPDA
jgi:hypothetical protein